mgnify:FL=1
MWFWLISAIAGSILGGATDSWFSETKCGIWFYGKADQIYSWAAKKLNIRILENEEKWRKKYPNVAEKIDALEKRVNHLDKIHLNDFK